MPNPKPGPALCICDTPHYRGCPVHRSDAEITRMLLEVTASRQTSGVIVRREGVTGYAVREETETARKRGRKG